MEPAVSSSLSAHSDVGPINDGCHNSESTGDVKEQDKLSFPFKSRIPFLVTEDYKHYDKSGYTISII
jgi:hypothetical protein